MKNSSNRTDVSSNDSSTVEGKPRLSLTRERVKDLRVQTGCRTGLLAFNGPLTGPVSANNNRCTFEGE